MEQVGAHLWSKSHSYRVRHESSYAMSPRFVVLAELPSSLPVRQELSHAVQVRRHTEPCGDPPRGRDSEEERSAASDQHGSVRFFMQVDAGGLSIFLTARGPPWAARACPA